MEIIDSWGY